MLLVVDAANVVGSVPDGWWRDRAGAAERLRDSLTGLAADPPGWLGTALAEAVGAAANAGPAGADPVTGVEVVLVVEGAARGVRSTDGVRVLGARGSGDDAIVDLVRGRPSGQDCVVVTADRELRARVRELGAGVVGPRSIWPAR